MFIFPKGLYIFPHRFHYEYFVFCINRKDLNTASYQIQELL